MFAGLIDSLSADRFRTYQAAAGYDDDLALALYSWNQDMASSFYPLLGMVEVCLRNCLARRVVEVYGVEWWDNTAFHDILGQKGKGIVLRAKQDLGRKQREITSGRMVAEISFGFWEKMLLEKYEAPVLRPLTGIFKYIPENVTIAELRNAVKVCRILRNRVSHHEPLISRNLTQDYSTALKLLMWISEPAHAWLKPQLRTMALLRQRPTSAR